MKNVMIYGFESGPMVRVLRKLEKDNVFSIKRWLYDEDLCDDWFRNAPVGRARTTLWRGEWQKPDEFANFAVNEEISRQMDWIMQELVRESDFFRETYYEYKNIANHMANEYYSELKKGNVDMVLFADVPHNHIAALLYIVARAMKIDTVFAVPLHYVFPKKFIYAHTIEDYGLFSLLPDYHANVPEWHIKKSFKKDLAYMTPKQIKLDRGEDWGRKLKFFHNPSLWIKERKSVIVKNFAKYDSVGDFLERKTVQLITRHFRKYAYRKNVQLFAGKHVDMNLDFVYVPLHLQPEMTVDTIGSIYRDQILVIEKIRNMIPNNWYIYVKENPKQLAIARDKYFFKRLSAIPNTVLVDRSVDTYELLEKSRFVATVTGTAAWESITGGKPALLFGNVWFKTFPGIVLYHEGLKVEEVINCSFAHHVLEKTVEAFTKKLCDGVWLNSDIDLIDNYNEEKNIRDLYDSFKFIFQ